MLIIKLLQNLFIKLKFPIFKLWLVIRYTN